jgi:putative ABC transport system substrate-binding protein
MKRRAFIALFGGAVVASPLAVCAQQAAGPLIGFLGSASPVQFADGMLAFHQGLNEIGFTEGQNVAIEYRWAENQLDRLPQLAADLVHRRVAVIATGGASPAALAAKAATTTIPVVFQVGVDPVALGLVESLNRPGSNVTGVTSLNVELAQKRLEVLHELVPTATTLALLVNPATGSSETQSQSQLAASRELGLQLYVLQASSEQEIDSVFASLHGLGISGLVISADPLFAVRNQQLAELSVRFGTPSISPYRAFAKAGGILSYGGSLIDHYRQLGVYTGRILKGARPADLPVEQITKVELIVNLKTAKALGLAIPPSVLARADEVIE